MLPTKRSGPTSSSMSQLFHRREGLLAGLLLRPTIPIRKSSLSGGTSPLAALRDVRSNKKALIGSVCNRHQSYPHGQRKIPANEPAHESSRPHFTLLVLFRHWGKNRQRFAVLAVAGATYSYWQYATQHPSTDNAYVQANTVQIAPSVSGIVAEVPVKSFAPVKAGDLLLRIDLPRFETPLENSAVAAPRKPVTKSERRGSSGRGRTGPHRARQRDHQIAGRRNRRQGLHPPRLDGKSGRRPSSPSSISSHWWVDANFKETDLTRIHPGQKATVSVDIYPGHEFSGVVEAVSPASTSAFSLLPAENATGNWIKLTQRFPVRVSLALKPDDPADAPRRLGQRHRRYDG